LTKSNGTLYNRTFWLLPLHWGKLLVRRGSRVLLAFEGFYPNPSALSLLW
jgi:hypothetical protein